MKLRRLPLSGTYQTRDLGGYAAQNGCVTRWGAVYRSDVPRACSEKDAVLLRKLDLQTVLDLRTAQQIREVPSVFASFAGVSYWNCPFAAGNRNAASSTDLPNIIMELLSDRENIARIMRLILQAPGAVLFHCTAGKDRTGIVAALLLLLVGVAKADVVADYALSYGYIRPMLRQMRKQKPDLPYWFGRSDPETMEEVLRRLGSAERYLSGCGLRANELAALRRRLCLEPEI